MGKPSLTKQSIYCREYHVCVCILMLCDLLHKYMYIYTRLVKNYLNIYIFVFLCVVAW